MSLVLQLPDSQPWVAWFGSHFQVVFIEEGKIYGQGLRGPEKEERRETRKRQVKYGSKK